MPRHPPIALKTLDRSHCQCPPCNPEGIVTTAQTRRVCRYQAASCAGHGFMVLAQKDQLLETCPRVRLGRPIMSGRLSVSPRQSKAFSIRPAGDTRSPGAELQLWNSNKSSLYDVYRTRVRPRPIAKPFSNDCSPGPLPSSRHQRGNPCGLRCNGGAGRDRTDDILLAKQALSQLSYGP